MGTTFSLRLGSAPISAEAALAGSGGTGQISSSAEVKGENQQLSGVEWREREAARSCEGSTLTQQ